MPHFVYSTHTNHTKYVKYKDTVNSAHNEEEKSIFIAGGHGTPDKYFQTRQGVVTIIHKDEDMDFLMSLDAFKDDIKKGFIVVHKKDRQEHKIVRDMCPRDGSAQKTPKDFPENKMPTTGGVAY